MAFSCPSYCCPPLFDNNSKSTRFKACRRPGPSLAGAPPLRTELASDAGGWTPRSAASANGAQGLCSWVVTGFVMRRASWSPRWLDASHRLHQPLPMQDGACLNGWNLRSDGLSAHRSHPSCGAWHLVSVRVGAVSGGGAEVVKQLHADVWLCQSKR